MDQALVENIQRIVNFLFKSFSFCQNHAVNTVNISWPQKYLFPCPTVIISLLFFLQYFFLFMTSSH